MQNPCQEDTSLTIHFSNDIKYNMHKDKCLEA